MRTLLGFFMLAAIGCGEVASSTPDAEPSDAVDVDASQGATITLARPSRWVAQAGSATLDFTLDRTTSTGALTVRVTGLPTGVTAADVEVAAGASTGTLTFTATTGTTLGASTEVTVELVAAGSVLDQADFTVRVSGAPGTVDPTFGTDGRRVLALPDPVVAATSGNAAARAIAQYPASAGADAGKIVIAADLLTSGAASNSKRIALARFNVDGSPDTSFGGGDGHVLLDAGVSPALSPVAVAIDSQGRVVVAALRFDTADVCRNVVMRVTTAGVVDPDFTTYDANPPDGYCGSSQGMAVIAGDKIEVVGWWNNPDGSQRPLLVQLASDGTPDHTAFPGDSYTLRLPNPGTGKPSMAPYQIVVDRQGRYLIPGFRCEGGWSSNGYTGCESVITRLTAAGLWDTSFGDGGTGGLGYSALTFGATPTPNVFVQAFYATTLDADGNVVAVGWTESAATGSIARFLGTTGALDSDFGSSGRITPVLVTGATSQSLDDVVIDDEGRIVAVGEATSGGALLLTTRYSRAGVLDTGYGTGGVQTVVGTSGVRPRAVLQVDGRLVVAGAYPRVGGGHDVVLWRFWP